MDRFFEALRPFIRGVVRKAGWVVALAVVCSGLGIYAAQNLRIDPDFANLIPRDYPSVQALERIRATVGGGETTVDMAIESPSFEANRAFAEALIPEALKLQGERYTEPYFVRAELRRDTEFLRNNALYFATDAELDQLQTYLEDAIYEAKLEVNPLFFDLDDDEEDDADTQGEEMRDSYDNIVGQEYRVSADSTTLVVRFFPGGSSTNINYIESLYGDFEALIAQVDPSAFHPAMTTTLAGRLWRQRVEVRAITDDVLGSFGVGMLCVLLTVVGYFFYKAYQARTGGGRFDARVLFSELARTPVMALMVGLPLLMSLTWTFGVAYLAVGALNLMTSTLGLVLFGLGIDYGIHFYARYAEERGAGHSVIDAAEHTFTSTGQAITVGALTTAAALYVLMVADFKGFSEFGFIGGTGVLFALLAMTVVMPALLAVCERFGLLNLEGAASGVAQETTPRRFPAARGIVLGSLVAVVAAVVLVPRVEFEYRFGSLEPTYPAWTEVNTKVRKAFSDRNRRNPAYVVVDDPAEVPVVVAAVRDKADREAAASALYERYKTEIVDSLAEAQFTINDPDSVRQAIRDSLGALAAVDEAAWARYRATRPDDYPAAPTPTVRLVESLQERFPLDEAGQQAKLARIAHIRDSLLTSPFLAGEDSDDLDKLRQAAQTRAPIAIEDVPDFLKKQFTSKSGELGGFITIFPSVGLSDGRNSIAFAEDIGTIETATGETYHAGSTSIVAADMLRLMQREAPYMVLATFVIVALLMWVNFGRLRWAFLALLPLVVGVLWMLLLMEVLGMRLNFYNLVVLPAVLGIGNDAGAHMVHRYREEGAGSIRSVLRSTGEHVTMGALTTMIGFAGLLLSFHPGLNTIGALAVTGIGTTLVAALLFLPALLQWLEDRHSPAPQPEPSVASVES